MSDDKAERFRQKVRDVIGEYAMENFGISDVGVLYRQPAPPPERIVLRYDNNDPRPIGCRFRLAYEGKPYPRSTCEACKRDFRTLGNSCQEQNDPP